MVEDEKSTKETKKKKPKKQSVKRKKCETFSCFFGNAPFLEAGAAGPGADEGVGLEVAPQVLQNLAVGESGDPHSSQNLGLADVVEVGAAAADEGGGLLIRGAGAAVLKDVFR
jgi:hypothetical protein